MMTAHDVNSVAFQRAVRGYRAEDVDKVLDDVAAQLEADAIEIETLKKANEELKSNMYLLAQKIEAYRTDEENLKSALINAQRMGENVIREAKQKAEGILREATVRADEVILNAQEEKAQQEIELQRVKAEVGQFKADVLSLYKRHIESLSTLPEEELEQSEEAMADDMEIFSQEEQELVQDAATRVISTVAQVSEFESSELYQEESVAEPVAELLQSEAIAQDQVLEQEESAASFWTKDETELKEAPATTEPEKKPAFQGFKGIKFSD